MILMNLNDAIDFNTLIIINNNNNSFSLFFVFNLIFISSIVIEVSLVGSL